jgi:hypothetical protein
MIGKCIISFDCESKWGMADHINSIHDELFTKKNLINVYGEILRVLRDKNIAATFAFVGAMTMDKNYFVDTWVPRLKKSDQHTVWLSRLYSDLNGGFADGWFMPELLSMVESSLTAHEIASHGFTHLPFDGANKQSIEIELEGIKDWMRIKNKTIDTFIFPRNLIADTISLKTIGVRGYRDKLDAVIIEGRAGRLLNLMKEFYPFCKSQSCKQVTQIPVAIPGGFFLNWRSGARRLVPIDLTIQRFKNALNHATKNEGVVHLWLHPHNLITGDNQMILFKKCVDVLAEEIGNGQITMMTQSQYVHWLMDDLYGSHQRNRRQGQFSPDYTCA